MPEFRKRIPLTLSLNLPRNLQISNSLPKLPDVDWSCISGSVRRQGKCGACYAFSPV